MANWSKLNAEFDEVINGITDTDWDKLEVVREQKKTLSWIDALKNAKEQEKKLNKK